MFDLLRKTFEGFADKKMFVVYCLESDEKKPEKKKKVPYNLRQRRAAVKKSFNWASLDDALAAVEDGWCDGLGVVMAYGLRGIDIDDCINEDGSLKDYAREIVESMDSYWEVSRYSGKGIHILFLCGEPVWTKSFYIDGGGRIEVFGNKEACTYLTVSGNIREWKPIAERSEAFKALLTKHGQTIYGGKSKNQVKKASPATCGKERDNNDEPPVFTGKRDAVANLLKQIEKEGDEPYSEEIFDALLLLGFPEDIAVAVVTDEKRLREKTEIRKIYQEMGIRYKVLDLFNGNTARYYNDDNRADFAAIRTLLRYTKDAATIEKIMRASGLNREKFDSTRRMRDDSRGTYLKRSIVKALAGEKAAGMALRKRAEDSLEHKKHN